MAIIMKSCCCFETIEKGTVASAIYSMLTSIIAFGWVTYRIQPLQTLFQDMEGDHELHLGAIYVSYLVAVILTICLVASAMILLIGTVKGNRFLFDPIPHRHSHHDCPSSALHRLLTLAFRKDQLCESNCFCSRTFQCTSRLSKHRKFLLRDCKVSAAVF